MKVFLVMRLVWKFLFFLKVAMWAFIVISSCTKLGHVTIIVLLTKYPTFFQKYHNFRITIKGFLYLKFILNAYFWKCLYFSQDCILDKDIYKQTINYTLNRIHKKAVTCVHKWKNLSFDELRITNYFFKGTIMQIWKSPYVLVFI